MNFAEPPGIRVRAAGCLRVATPHGGDVLIRRCDYAIEDGREVRILDDESPRLRIRCILVVREESVRVDIPWQWDLIHNERSDVKLSTIMRATSVGCSCIKRVVRCAS